METVCNTVFGDIITSPFQLPDNIEVNASRLEKVTQQYPMLINSNILDLIRKYGDPISLQFLPDMRELHDTDGLTDSLYEDFYSPVANIIHRYPDRILFLISDKCGAYCRFCTRKRKIGKTFVSDDKTLENGISYIKEHGKIHDVLLSGGDPLMLPDDRLYWILSKLKEIPHVKIIRIGTRIPSVMPQRITSELVEMLKQFHPLFIMVHFNHSFEITDEAERACLLFADNGFTLLNQTVLLKGINDNPSVQAELAYRLLQIRIKPYYLHHCDLTKGTGHFRTSVRTGIKIIEKLWGSISGLAMPTYVIDIPGGGGKIPVTPEYIQQIKGDSILIKNYQGNFYKYYDPAI